jgi:hypothetical protein
MGLIILPVAAFFFLIWLAITGLLVALVVAMMRSVPGKPIPQIVAAVAVVALCWLLPNASGLQAQSSLDKITGDCGWTIYKKGPPVDGVYVGLVEGSHVGWSYDMFLSYYPRIQYKARIGEPPVQVARGQRPQPIPARSLKYGIRLNREELHGGMLRFTQQIVDFDADEVLAKYVIYDQSSRAQSGIASMAYSLLTVQPKACKLRFDEFESRLYEVLPLAGAKQCAAGSYLSKEGSCCSWSGSTLSCG